MSGAAAFRVLRAGFPLDFFPVLFVVPRVVGWLAHWRQMMLQEGGVKIWRPRQVRVFKLDITVLPRLNMRLMRCPAAHTASLQVYVGPSLRDYVPVEDREPVEGLKQTPSAVQHGGCVAARVAFVLPER